MQYYKSALFDNSSLMTKILPFSQNVMNSPLTTCLERSQADLLHKFKAEDHQTIHRLIIKTRNMICISLSQ